MSSYSSLIKTIFLLAIITLIGLTAVTSRESDRVYQNLDPLQQRLILSEQEVSDLQNKPVLPSLESVWQAASLIAGQYNVHLTELQTKESSFIKETDLPGGATWYGVLQGPADKVAFAAMEMQRQLPITFGSNAIQNSISGLSLAISGISLDYQRISQ